MGWQNLSRKAIDGDMIKKYGSKKTYRDPLIMGILIGVFVAIGIINAIPSSILGIRGFSVYHATNILKIHFAAVAGGVIGFEREHKNRPAGLRTHALVSIGAAIVMLIPIELSNAGGTVQNFDVTRLGAQVISGIGFLGAGTIIRDGASVKGLTTAASLWVAAIIGLAIGAGNYLTGFVSLLLVMFILKIFGSFEHRQGLKYKEIILNIKMKDVPQQIGLINALVENLDMKLRKMEIVENSSKVKKNGDAVIRTKLFVRGEVDMDEDLLIEGLNHISSIIKVECETCDG